MPTTLRGRRRAMATAAWLSVMFATSVPAADLKLQSGSVTVDGEQIYFESVGAGDPVVLSHDPAKAFLYKQIGGASPAGISEKLRTTSYPLEAVRRLSVPVLVIMGAEEKTFPLPPFARSLPRSRALDSRCCRAPGTPLTSRLRTPGTTWS